VITAGYLVYLGGLGAAFGLRTWLQVRRTGSSGFNGISGPRGSLSWWAGVLFVLALLLGILAPALLLAGVTTGASAALPPVVGAVGLVVLVVGVVAVLLAQSGMGTSWRIGVDDTERTGLVTTGVFAVVRNPIFTAMVLAQAGMTLLAPTAVSAVALACLVLAVQLQVRVIEEPYLARVHGAAYLGYAGRTGRFLPRLGRGARTGDQLPGGRSGGDR
jgi:protein-S-isoprenylcysteine O-methyltransferase Ste14